MSEFDLSAYLAQLENANSIKDCVKVPVPSIQSDQNYIFVSYSHADYKKVYYDLAHLYDRGIRFWYDKGLSAGEDWEREVKEHIQSPRCCGVIFYLSPNMFMSKSVFKEIEFTNLKKRPNIIMQKNYFCVNLEDSNISDMLYSVQTFQREHGLTRLDTKELNVLTSTFSDDDTYIQYTSPHHVEELVEQIQRKFDVTNTSAGASAEELALGSMTNPRLALFAFTAKETDPIPLFKFLYADFKKNRGTRPWHFLIWGAVVGLLASMAMLYRVCTLPDAPMLPEVVAFTGMTAFVIFTVVESLFFIPYVIAKVFWLFYISPVRHKGEKNQLTKVALFLLYLSAAALLSAFCTPLSLIVLYVAVLLINYITPYFS